MTVCGGKKEGRKRWMIAVKVEKWRRETIKEETPLNDDDNDDGEDEEWSLLTSR